MGRPARGTAAHLRWMIWLGLVACAVSLACAALGNEPVSSFCQTVAVACLLTVQLVQITDRWSRRRRG